MNTFDIKTELRKLDIQKLEEIKTECEYLISRNITKSKKEEVENEFASNFYGILSGEAVKQNINSFPSLYIFMERQPKLYKKYLESCAEIEKWLNESFDKETARDFNFTKRIIAKIYIRAVRDYHKDRVNLTIIINTLHKLPEVFEAQFPGYLRSGLQSVITKNKKYKK